MSTKLLSCLSPLQRHQLQIQFRSHVQISSDFADWLERILDPAIAYRFANAKDALAVLQGEQKLRRNVGRLFYQSPQKQIALLKSQNQLILELKPIIGQRDRFDLLRRLTRIIQPLLPLLLWDMSGLFLVNLIAVPSFYGDFYETIRFTNHPDVIFLITLYNWIFAGCVLFLILGMLFLIVYGLIGVLSIATFLIQTTSRTGIELTPHGFQIKRWMLGLCYWNVRGQFADTTLINWDKIKIPLLRHRIKLCSLKSPRRKHWLGIGLSGSEQKWLVREIREFLGI